MASIQNFLDEGGAKVGRPVIAKNSEAFAKADPLTIDSSGWLVHAGIGDRIVGWSLEDITASATNQTVAMYCPCYAEARDVEVVMTADQAAVQADVGGYADIATATSGAYVVDLVSIASGQLFVTQIDPYNTGTTTQIVVKVAENQADAYAQAAP